jgi:uncharacterized membrane protein YbhN (UPF0104 family)
LSRVNDTTIKLRDGSAPASGKKTRLTARPWWPWFRRIAGLLFLIFVVTLLTIQARQIEWNKVLTALQDYPITASWGAVLLACVSFALYGCYDLLGRYYTGHKLGVGAVMTTAAVSYGFTLNLGSLVGGIGVRLRLYSRLGLALGDINRVISFSMLTNWLGYVLLSGLIFSFVPPALPENWKVDTMGLRLIGFALLAIAGGYFAACALLRVRKRQIRGHEIELPSARLAALQFLTGASNWLVMSGILFILLQHRIEFFMVVSVLMVAAIAGVIFRVPANLGVLEAVFIALLANKMPQAEILAALVAYRVVYYLIPLALATVTYGVLEARAKKLAKNAKT